MKDRELVQITRSKRIDEREFARLADAMFVKVWENLLPPQILSDGLPSKVSDNIITTPGLPVPDCMTCGACCAGFVCVSTAPDAGIPASDCWEITSESTGRQAVDRYIRRRTEDLSCVELEGEIGSEVSCRIYDDRPRMCQTFEAGSDRCHAVRRAYGLEPFLTLDEMSAANAKLADRKPLSADVHSVIKSAEIAKSDRPGMFCIIAKLGDGSRARLHEYDPTQETWFKSQFEGLGLKKARDILSSVR